MNQRVKLAAILIVFEIVSYLTLSITPRDDTYYLVAGAFSLAIIPVLFLVGNSKLVIRIAFLSLMVLFTQVIGFAIYHLNYPIKIYNYAIHILLSLQFLILLIDWISNDGRDKNANRNPLLHCDKPSSNSHIYEKTK